MSTTRGYDDIELSWHPKDIKFEQRANCEAYLRKRQEQGESRRKILSEPRSPVVLGTQFPPEPLMKLTELYSASGLVDHL